MAACDGCLKGSVTGEVIEERRNVRAEVLFLRLGSPTKVGARTREDLLLAPAKVPIWFVEIEEKEVDGSPLLPQYENVMS